MINTLIKTPLHIKQTGDYVILLEDLEFAMPKDQLREITQLHNNGMKLEDISQEVKRNEYEVLIALMHQAKRGVRVRPFAYRRG
ncbi:hypothetical protein [Paucisalibacillus globulus]|uniref:hypothetical protein n=1 Tax=Paucisalibacillus globulus TaxID=351095 RepID=UPI000BB78151|nr:hypothetical protein [Paucisalibacillus globulus]